MDKQFEEISSMLDKVVGGQNLFDINTGVSDDHTCTVTCAEWCPIGTGTLQGAVKGFSPLPDVGQL